ncbi:hypothetical protein CAOG_02456 [Capsaspora owczarzaki ATCC 30864]|uniref:Uncharacterized protein n=1 Tax=Capsaspora owczarzaki (strain ATCC 30864) TaxID=595528 RepID=A0A0D2WL96_CAPO3|nr:hypothetical protein CAOG_02456 [Capsaspora owczarzaki ATCC 30864]KJE91300.1 hypothetical protein CAOG_002456 [Capsaspora owczarzaki ATCC 30864]|eukprot:XP_004349206.1 hypothetical protein CAOG_02456 [Capsaspora owczarzaki ATCC 30864]
MAAVDVVGRLVATALQPLLLSATQPSSSSASASVTAQEKLWDVLSSTARPAAVRCPAQQQPATTTTTTTTAHSANISSATSNNSSGNSSSSSANALRMMMMMNGPLLPTKAGDDLLSDEPVQDVVAAAAAAAGAAPTTTQTAAALDDTNSSKKRLWDVVTSGEIKRAKQWRGAPGERALFLALKMDPNTVPLPVVQKIDMGTHQKHHSKTGSTATAAAAASATFDLQDDFGFFGGSAAADAPQSNARPSVPSGGLLDFSLFDEPAAPSVSATAGRSLHRPPSSAPQPSSLALLDDEFLGFSSASVPPAHPSAGTLVDPAKASVLASLPASFLGATIPSSAAAPPLSDQAKRLLSGLPDYSYMHSHVLMFPTRDVQNSMIL